MPISWHGTLAQYAGRLHRTHSNKKEVVIYDYIDLLYEAINASIQNTDYFVINYNKPNL